MSNTKTPEEIDALVAKVAEQEKRLQALKTELNQAQARAPRSSTPTETSRDWPLEKDEYTRYGRQMILPEIGLPGISISSFSHFPFYSVSVTNFHEPNHFRF